jgi:hypothetical protein
MPDPILPNINSPADIKALPDEALPLLAEEVRTELIRILSDDNPKVGRRPSRAKSGSWSNSASLFTGLQHPEGQISFSTSATRLRPQAFHRTPRTL